MCSVLLVSLALTVAITQAAEAKERAASPEGRAVAFLAREVPRWHAENKCYSCHNNGDAARALYTAARLSYPVPPKALADTTSWLSKPEGWDRNGGEGPFSDKALARLQFAAALAEALEAGQMKDRQVLVKAAERIAGDQRKDGSWQVDAQGNVGSPATYGACLATGLARRTLRKADPERCRAAIAKADRWLEEVPVKNVLDAAAVLLGLEGNEAAAAVTQQRHCLTLIRKGQSKEGGWGPYVNAVPEPFDTAVVLLALARLTDQPESKTMLRAGRAYLLTTQKDDGSWQETTRPAGAESYAQRVSTTGWATLALLLTQSKSD